MRLDERPAEGEAPAPTLLEQLGGQAEPASPPVILISGQDQGYSAGRLAGQLALHQPQGWRLGELNMDPVAIIGNAGGEPDPLNSL